MYLCPLPGFAAEVRIYFTRRAQSVYELLPLKDWPGESERPLVVELPQGPYLLLTEAEVVNYVHTKSSWRPAKPIPSPALCMEP
jgi:hypothetical protein